MHEFNKMITDVYSNLNSKKPDKNPLTDSNTP